MEDKRIVTLITYSRSFCTHGPTTQPAFLLYLFLSLTRAVFCLRPNKIHLLGSILDKLYCHDAFRNTLQLMKNDQSALKPKLSQQSVLQQFFHHFPLQRLHVNLPVQPVLKRPRRSYFPLFTITHCSSPRLLSVFIKALGILFEPTCIGNERTEHSWSSPFPSLTTPPLLCTLFYCYISTECHPTSMNECSTPRHILIHSLCKAFQAFDN